MIWLEKCNFNVHQLFEIIIRLWTTWIHLFSHQVLGQPNFRKLMASDSTVSPFKCILYYVWNIWDKSILLNGYASKNTNFKWKKFDGTDLNYTNWEYGHPGTYSSVVIYVHSNGKVTKGHKRSKMGLYFRRRGYKQGWRWFQLHWTWRCSTRFWRLRNLCTRYADRRIKLPAIFVLSSIRDFSDYFEPIFLYFGTAK